MASKLILFFHVVLALATLSAVELEARRRWPPAIHFTNAVTGNDSPQISIQVKSSSTPKGSAQLSPGQSYWLDVNVRNEVYHTIAVFGLRYTAFHAYEPARDKGRKNMFWRADNDGFALSYNKIDWKVVAPWESA